MVITSKYSSHLQRLIIVLLTEIIKCQLPFFNKYSVQTEAVNDIVDDRENYVELPDVDEKPSKKKKRFPTSDKAENSLIQTLWFYQNADAS